MASPVASAALQWRPVTHEVQGRNLVDSRQTDGVELYGQQGAIIVKTPRRVTVRVFTILGQLVSQATLSPGTSELRMGARGIYIVKIGDVTQKVAL